MKPNTPAWCSPARLGQVAGHRAAPETHVHVRGPPGGGPLDRQCGGRGRRRQAVQRHVDQRGHPARGGRPGRGREALPLGAARLVDVHVGVHQAGQQHLGAGQCHGFDGVRGRPGPGDRGDAPVADGHRRRAHPVRGDRPLRPDHQFVLGHASSLPPCRPQPTLLPPWPCIPDSFVLVGPTTTKECGHCANHHKRSHVGRSPAATYSPAGTTVPAVAERGWEGAMRGSGWRVRCGGGGMWEGGAGGMWEAAGEARPGEQGRLRWRVCRFRARGKGVTCPALPT